MSPSDQPFVPAAGKDWLLPFYDPLTRLLGVEKVHRRLLEQAAIGPGARVLEIGCGTGNLSLLAKRLHPDAEVIGTDPDPAALARARRKATRGGLAARFEPAYAQQLPFPDASFDRVVSALMLHHIPADAKLPVLREVCRVLTPGGSLHLVDLDQEHRGLHGFLAGVFHARHGSSRRESVLEVLQAAGFAGSQVVAQQRSIMGRISYYRAVSRQRGPGEEQTR